MFFALVLYYYWVFGTFWGFLGKHKSSSFCLGCFLSGLVFFWDLLLGRIKILGIDFAFEESFPTMHSRVGLLAFLLLCFEIPLYFGYATVFLIFPMFMKCFFC
ncbi:hypothetical protein FPQ18DRAFT_89944 [Pyronema domesticum]|nr:hypothetical protein FPQ18DRAFT_89944 [Pyronema domesticum]